jgi:flagellin
MFTLNNVSSMYAVNNLTRLGAALALSDRRLTSSKRVTCAADDPSGIVSITNFSSQLARIEGSLRNGDRISSEIDAADGAMAEIQTLLGNIETSMTSASGATDEDDLAAYQAEIDLALAGINRLVNTTTFNGSYLLNGQKGYTITGADSDDLSDIRISSANTTGGSLSVTVSVSAPTAGFVTSSDIIGGLAGDVTFTVTGPDGNSMEFNFLTGTGRSTIRGAVNAWSGTLDVVAENSGNGLVFTSQQAGATKAVTVNVTAGSAYFTVDGASSATDYGEDAIVIVNGQTTDIDDETQEASFSTAGISGTLALTDAFYTGPDATTTFTISGSGSGFRLGVSASDAILLGQPTLATSSLGNAKLGYLSSLGSGGANDISSENFSEALDIVSKASGQVSISRARFGAVKTNTIDSSINSLEATQTAVTNAKSAIEDIDYATETANNTRLQLMAQATAAILSNMSSTSSSILMYLLS